MAASSSKFIDIDSDEKDPLLCSLYAPEIHYNMRVAEVINHPLGILRSYRTDMHLVLS